MPITPVELIRNCVTAENIGTHLYVPTNRIFSGIPSSSSTSTSIPWVRTGASTSTTSPIVTPIMCNGTVTVRNITSSVISSATSLDNWYITTSSDGFISYYTDSRGSILDTHQFVYKPSKINHKKIRFETNQAKKALWKSIRLFESLFGINDIRLFLKGDSFEITGRKFNYVISKRRDNLIEHTKNPTSFIIPYQLEVYNKAGVHLFNGCTVFKDTPIIDQITAVLLHVKSGEEEYILKNMNLQSIKNDLYFDHDSVEYLNKVKNLKLIPKLRC